MARPTLTIDLDAIAANWAALDAASGPKVETGAVLKADAYGLGLEPVARRLRAAGARSFFVAIAEEAVALRRILGPGPAINVFSGYMAGDRAAIAESAARPLLNSPGQAKRFAADFPGAPCGIQFDSGMHRLGMEPHALAEADLRALDLRLAISHLACADDPDHPQNALQLRQFRWLAALLPRVPLSLSATGGILLGPDYHFDVTRPGIGLYGGLPFADARPVVTLDLPVIQTRTVATGSPVGYGATWTAPAPTRVATVAAGYADGLLRTMSGRGLALWADGIRCPLVGRISMDLITVDVSRLRTVPDTLRLLGPEQGVDVLADAAGSIGYEILTSLGHRYERVYKTTD